MLRSSRRLPRVRPAARPWRGDRRRAARRNRRARRPSRGPSRVLAGHQEPAALRPRARAGGRGAAAQAHARGAGRSGHPGEHRPRHARGGEGSTAWARCSTAAAAGPETSARRLPATGWPSPTPSTPRRWTLPAAARRSRCCGAPTRCTATTTSSARRSSRTTSGWARRAIPISSAASARSPRSRWRSPASTGTSRPPSRWRATTAGAAPTRATPRIPSWCGPARGRWSRACRARRGAESFLGPGKVIATAKHFLGDGGTAGGSDQGDNRSSEPELRDVHGAGYVGALGAGVQAVMVSFSSWHGSKMHRNSRAAHRGPEAPPGLRRHPDRRLERPRPGAGLRQRELRRGHERRARHVHGARGLEGALRQHPGAGARGRDPARPARRRGAPHPAGQAARRTVHRRPALAAPAGRRLRPASALPSTAPWRGRRCANRWCCSRTARRGRPILPLRPRQRVLVAGDGAHDIGKQSGGWTITWQGDGNTNRDFPGATSIWEGIRAAVEAAGGSATLRDDGPFTEKPDVAIVVFGEDPYAEFEGDRETIVFEAAEELALLRRLRGAGVPVVSVFLSGRPLWVNPLLDASDAFVAAWLPGSEGGGIADVLFTTADGARAPRFPRQALLLVAEAARAGGAQCRRSRVRPALPLRLRPDLRRPRPERS